MKEYVIALLAFLTGAGYTCLWWAWKLFYEEVEGSTGVGFILVLSTVILMIALISWTIKVLVEEVI